MQIIEKKKKTICKWGMKELILWLSCKNSGYGIYFKGCVLKVNSESGLPWAALVPVSWVFPSSIHSRRGWERRAEPCRSIYSRLRNSPSPPCKNLPRAHFLSASERMRPGSKAAWCTYSGSRIPLMSCGLVPPQRSKKEMDTKWRKLHCVLWPNDLISVTSQNYVHFSSL